MFKVPGLRSLLILHKAAGIERWIVFKVFWVLPWTLIVSQTEFIKNDGNGFFYESLWANSAILYCCCMISASAGAFARPSLLFHADNCPHLNHRPTIGSNWHVALAVLGEIWGCIRPRTGCPFHQLESCLLVGRGRGEVYLTATLSLDQNDLWRSFFSSLLSSSLPASLSRHWGITVCELLVRVFSQGPQPATDSLTVAVSGTFTLEVLWQSGCARQDFQWKCSTQFFAAGFLIHNLLALFSIWTFFFFFQWMWRWIGFGRSWSFSELLNFSLFSLVAGALFLLVVASPGISICMAAYGLIMMALTRW